MSATLKLGQKVKQEPLAWVILKDAHGVEVGRVYQAEFAGDDAITLPKAPPAKAVTCDLLYRGAGAIYGVTIAKGADNGG